MTEVFNTQKECWDFLVNGGCILLDDVKIKFIHGTLCAIVKGKWTPVHITFENPHLFKKHD